MAKRKTKKDLRQETVITNTIIAIILIAILIFALTRSGLVGCFLDNLLIYLFGSFYYFALFSGIFLALYKIFLYKKFYLGPKIISGIILVNIALILLAAFMYTTDSIGVDVINNYFSVMPDLLSDKSPSLTGGIIGALLYGLTSTLFDQTGTIVVIAVLFIISLLLLVPYDVFLKIYDKTGKMSEANAKKREERKAIKEREKALKRERMMIEENERLQNEELVKISNENIFIDDIKDEVKEELPEYHGHKAFIDLDVNEIKEEALNDESLNKHEEVKLDIPLSNEISEKPQKLEADHFSQYKLPSINVFEKVSASKSGNINKTSADLKGKKVIEILHNFGIEAELIKTHIGPSVTKFEIKPNSNVKVSRIAAISDNIKMELAARDIRIEAPIPGRSAVGIEIPNVESVAVRMYDLISTSDTSKASDLMFYVGKDLMGKSVTCEIDKMPHLLIAGATGSGKSVCINAIISSILYRTNPSKVKLVLVDPKKVEFTPYHDVPHLLWPVITDAQMASNMLKKVVVMMEGRFDIFAEAGVRNIKTYNEYVKSYNASLNPNDEDAKPMKEMPFIVVIIDELADLMMIAGKDVEASIQRITQLARASGIHLIVATQRPSTDVITGIIKSNIPSRISFSVASSIDSRTILDQAGAERLLGNGDMLYFPQGETSPIRLQGVYVTDKEVKNVTTYTKGQAKPDYDDTYFEFLNANSHSVSASTRSEKDDLYDDVKAYVIDVQKASTSLLQRRFGIGYNRAAGLIEALEENGIVGPQNGSKPREVYIKKEEESDE